MIEPLSAKPAAGGLTAQLQAYLRRYCQQLWECLLRPRTFFEHLALSLGLRSTANSSNADATDVAALVVRDTSFAAHAPLQQALCFGLITHWLSSGVVFLSQGLGEMIFPPPSGFAALLHPGQGGRGSWLGHWPGSLGSAALKQMLAFLVDPAPPWRQPNLAHSVLNWFFSLSGLALDPFTELLSLTVQATFLVLAAGFLLPRGPTHTLPTGRPALSRFSLALITLSYAQSFSFLRVLGAWGNSLGLLLATSYGVRALFQTSLLRALLAALFPHFLLSASLWLALLGTFFWSLVAFFSWGFLKTVGIL